MLKYMTYMAILANLILALWIFSQPKPLSQEDKIKPIPEDKRLVLLSELYPEQDEGAALPDNVELENTPLPEIEVVQAVEKEEEEQEPEPVQSPSEEPQLANNPEPLEPDDPEDSDIFQVCYTIGPFLTREEANKTGKRMQDEQLIVERREKTEKLVYGYRVYIPPLPTRQEANVITRELSDLGILDYFIITGDEQENGISLGVFKQKSGAIRRMAQIRRFNFNVKMEARHKETIVFWLDVIDQEQSFTRQLWTEISEDGQQLQRLTKKC